MSDRGVTLDLRGLRCPLPVLRLRKLTESMPTNTIVNVLVTDPAALQDIPAYAEERGWRVVESTMVDHMMRIQLKL